jgi:hypothetical protein
VQKRDWRLVWNKGCGTAENPLFVNLKQKEKINFSDPQALLNSFLPVINSNEVSTFETIADCLISGSAIFMVYGSNLALSLVLKKWEKRNIEKPETETVVRGASKN